MEEQEKENPKNTVLVDSNTKSSVRVKDAGLLARMVVREGKCFRESALAAGYSKSTADKGLKWLLENSSEVSAAISRESAAIAVGLDRMKPFAVKRLFDEITNPKSALGIKAIEVAGRFKETDWFVKTGADVQIGIFGSLADAAPEPVIDVYAEDASNEP